MNSRLKLFDWTLIVVPLLLLLLGLVVIYAVTFVNVHFKLAQLQLIYAGLGLVAAITMMLLDYRNWQSLAYVSYIIGLLLLGAVFVFGSRQFGASRWIDLGLFQLQPSEIFKLVLILVQARLLAAWSGQMTIQRLVIFLVMAFIPIGLVLKQPDLGTAGVLVIVTFGMLAFARLPWRWWLALILIGIIAAPVGYSHLHDYQKRRLSVFLNATSDKKKEGYNVEQAKIAIGSGGLIGQGLGRGSQSQLNFLPVAHTDFIFSGLAEATGLFGCLILISLYAVFILRIFRVAEAAKDEFGCFLALGLAIMFAFQIIVNIGMNLGLLPVTGIPLPFVSFGGTSLIVNMTSVGILESIYARHKKITF